VIDPFLLLFAGHAVGDWIVQTDAQAAGKSWPRPESERAAALALVGVDDNHPDPLLDQEHAATMHQWAQSWLWNQAHISTYHLTIWLCLIPYVLGISSAGIPHVLLALAASWIVHSFIDRRWPVRWLLAHTGSAKFAETPLGMLAADQALHVATLAIMAAYLQAVAR
jgi:hypothetical protein